MIASELFASKTVNRTTIQLNLSDEFIRFITKSVDSNSAHSDTSCDAECVRFRDILLNWPPDKPKAAVYYLAKADRLAGLNNSLTSLYRNFLYRYDYPVIIFHEADSRYWLHANFCKHVNIRLFLQEVNFEIPDHISNYVAITCRQHDIGYRHMCRFHAKQVYEQAILVGLEYVWRLDDDSLVHSSINYDLFAFMQRQRIQYSYIRISMDSRECTTGLWTAVKRYMKIRHIQSSFFSNWKERNIFYNNFEISALSLWISKQYQDYINFIDLIGGIYYYRWGDAPIKTIAVTLFLPQNSTHLFTDFMYQHASFFNRKGPKPIKRCATRANCSYQDFSVVRPT